MQVIFHEAPSISIAASFILCSLSIRVISSFCRANWVACSTYQHEIFMHCRVQLRSSQKNFLRTWICFRRASRRSITSLPHFFLRENVYFEVGEGKNVYGVLIGLSILAVSVLISVSTSWLLWLSSSLYFL